jgi:hypothetical protein
MICVVLLTFAPCDHATILQDGTEGGAGATDRSCAEMHFL